MKKSSNRFILVIVTILSVLVAVILFFGSISGPGNPDLLTAAGFIIALPVVLLIYQVSQATIQSDDASRSAEQDTANMIPENDIMQETVIHNDKEIDTRLYKSRWTAGVLALLLGAFFGAHRFYVGAWGMGIINILCFIYFGPLIPFLIALVEAIRYFTLSQAEFEYKVNQVKGPFSIVW